MTRDPSAQLPQDDLKIAGIEETKNDGYVPLVVKVPKTFRTNKRPVPPVVANKV